MKFDVDWTHDALNQLTTIWNGAADRQSVTDAADMIDELLARDPRRHGRHQAEGLYVCQVNPLRVSFEIDDANRRVTVTSAWPV